jgi:ABC-type phosphate/phosphonate transport system permease subunit
MTAGRVATRGLRKAALVALMLVAAVAAPVALPIRMLIARRNRPTETTEQVVRDQDAVARTLPSTV